MKARKTCVGSVPGGRTLGDAMEEDMCGECPGRKDTRRRNGGRHGEEEDNPSCCRECLLIRVVFHNSVQHLCDNQQSLPTGRDRHFCKWRPTLLSNYYFL